MPTAQDDEALQRICEEVEAEWNEGARPTLTSILFAKAVARRYAATVGVGVPDQWRPIETAPKDGTKVLLRFPPPWHDPAEDGICTGQWTERGWWLSALWASTNPHREPVQWAAIPAPPSA